MRVDIFGTEKCKVTFGLKYIICLSSFHISKMPIPNWIRGWADRFKSFLAVRFSHMHNQIGGCLATHLSKSGDCIPSLQQMRKMPP